MNAQDISNYIKRLESDLAQRDKSIVNLLDQLEEAKESEAVKHFLDLMEPTIANVEKLKNHSAEVREQVAAFRVARPKK